MSFSQYFAMWNFFTFAKFLISVGLGLSGFSLALCLKQRTTLKGRWYTSLRHILTLITIAAFSNAYTIILLGYVHIQPTELFLNVSMLCLLGWIWCFYRYNLIKHTGKLSFEKVLKFLHNEVSGDESAPL